MSIEVTRNFLLWCTVINYGILWYGSCFSRLRTIGFRASMADGSIFPTISSTQLYDRIVVLILIPLTLTSRGSFPAPLRPKNQINLASFFLRLPQPFEVPPNAEAKPIVSLFSTAFSYSSNPALLR